MAGDAAQDMQTRPDAQESTQRQYDIIEAAYSSAIAGLEDGQIADARRFVEPHLHVAVNCPEEHALFAAPDAIRPLATSMLAAIAGKPAVDAESSSWAMRYQDDLPVITAFDWASDKLTAPPGK